MSAAELKRAKYEAEQARKRLLSTAGELQQRLKPGTLANHAWTGVKDRGSEIADDAVSAVKDRPRVASGALAAFTLYLARKPIRSAVSRLFRGSPDEDLVTTRVTSRDEHYDLTAPVAARNANEGASA
jgi:hypothetical protein